ncbi:carbohydrate ABC transporter permease [Reinekea blandensis]|uniref:ABC-type sugar transport system, permease component n=1 Tax=Reinekea blandensis MED297 TaxID=314283 RepID=A4BJP4_9GAMM|nr:sugar ABC transporter permease [Reinekea blandensis]EAR07684.1 ABC-type sugar transport system, permease component [Reinekea sp. MED297] [Reinekea blandensis MED297]
MYPPRRCPKLEETNRSKRQRFLNKFTPYGFLSPYLIIYGVFGIFPVFFMVYLSFHMWNPVEGLGSMEFVGFENYVLGLTDPTLWQTMWNTLVMAVLSGVPQHLVALPMAYLLVMLGSRARHWFTTAYFLPYITSTVAVSMIFYVMYSKDSGIINAVLAQLADGSLTSWLFGGLKDVLPLGWVQENSLIRYSVSFVVWWKYVGFNIVIYTAGLATINPDLYEAATIDGANSWQRFTRVSLPLLKPFIFFGVTLTIIGNMNLFDEPYVLTVGGQFAQTAGKTISNYLYQIAWEWLDMGSAAAISWILFVVIGIFTGLYFWFFGRQGLGDE